MWPVDPGDPGDPAEGDRFYKCGEDEVVAARAWFLRLLEVNVYVHWEHLLIYQKWLIYFKNMYIIYSI